MKKSYYKYKITVQSRCKLSNILEEHDGFRVKILLCHYTLLFSKQKQLNRFHTKEFLFNLLWRWMLPAPNVHK